MSLTPTAGEGPLSAARIREDFDLPPSLVYLNTASSAPLPRSVLEAMTRYYQLTPVNYRSGETPVEQEVTQRVTAIRASMANFINARSPEEVIFTKNTTEAINLVASGLAWNEGDEVVLSVLEHQSNLIPWIRLESSSGITVRYITPRDPSGIIDPAELAAAITPRTRLISVHHVSNLVGCVQDIAALAKVAHERGVLMMIDAAQSEGRIPFNVAELGCDFAVSCARKGLLGPQGIGLLWGRTELLDGIRPVLIGGQAADIVDEHAYRAAELPFRFEAGIPNTAGLIGLGAALDYFAEVGAAAIYSHIQSLTDYALELLGDIPGVAIHGPRDPKRQPGIIPFATDRLSPRDVAAGLHERAQAVVAAGTCGSPLAARALGVPGVNRISLHCFNTVEEIDVVVNALRLLLRAG